MIKRIAAVAVLAGALIAGSAGVSQAKSVSWQHVNAPSSVSWQK